MEKELVDYLEDPLEGRPIWSNPVSRALHQGFPQAQHPNPREGFNARIACEQVSILRCKEDCNSIWLTEERNHQWTRVSEDNKSYNFFGEQLLTLCGAFDLVICNGVARWANSGNFTCNTYNGASVVDYAICSHGLCEKMEEVLIGEQLWELKSDHKPIYLSLTWAEQQQHGTKN
jgi:hypothetical protein